jgi:hypothetical protein
MFVFHNPDDFILASDCGNLVSKILEFVMNKMETEQIFHLYFIFT